MRRRQHRPLLPSTISATHRHAVRVASHRLRRIGSALYPRPGALHPAPHAARRSISAPSTRNSVPHCDSEFSLSKEHHTPVTCADVPSEGVRGRFCPDGASVRRTRTFLGAARRIIHVSSAPRNVPVSLIILEPGAEPPHVGPDCPFVARSQIVSSLASIDLLESMRKTNPRVHFPSLFPSRSPPSNRSSNPTKGGKNVSSRLSELYRNGTCCCRTISDHDSINPYELL